MLVVYSAVEIERVEPDVYEGASTRGGLLVA
jgi:hypothetical protein